MSIFSSEYAIVTLQRKCEKYANDNSERNGFRHAID